MIIRFWTEPGETERRLYQITISQSDGSTRLIAPFALADLGDGDNNHLLCLDQLGSPRTVFFPVGYLVDPNHDLNPDTTIMLAQAKIP